MALPLWLLALFALLGPSSVSAFSSKPAAKALQSLAAVRYGKRELKSHPWLDTTLGPDERAGLLLPRLNRSEKLQMLGGICMSSDASLCPYVGVVPGVPRLGVPALNMQDGPQGFRNVPFADHTTTSWPGAMAVAATWDREAVRDWGVAMGSEFYTKGANVQLGPGLNVARVPRNGRNFEYLAGEDPVLGRELAGPLVRGIQSQHVMACGKHFVANSEETHRFDGSEDVSHRALREIYYPPFEGAVNAGLASMMCSYNQVNGIWGCENNATFNDLRRELGFTGFMMSDWGATHSAALSQGLDIEMPLRLHMNESALAAAGASETQLDNAIHRILRSMFAVGVMDEDSAAWSPKNFPKNTSTPERNTLARRLSADGTVLLKNDGAVLPVPRNVNKIAVIGFASDNAWNLAYGKGSGEVQPAHLVTPLAGIQSAVSSDTVVYFDNGEDLDAAAKLARAADYAVVFVGASASEGTDRSNLGLDGNCASSETAPCDGNDENQNKLVEVVAKANKRTIVVLSVPGAILMPWSKEVPAILTNFMPGQQVGNAVADVLFGKVNPAARLPVTMPNEENEMEFTTKQFPGEMGDDGIYHVAYDEELLVGYRWYEAHNVSFTTGFPFGHGLSYTTFEYSDLHVDSGNRTVFFTVTNTGAVAGREVAQLYMDFPAEAREPPRQLKAFQKTSLLAPGDSARVALTLDIRAMSVFDESLMAWRPVSGTFRVAAGASSRDLRLGADLVRV